jgi:tRNA(Arg) A34 adenosine deaminase TadA
MTPEAFMEEAFALARTAKASEGTAPFGAVVVKDGEIVGRGLNRARACFDPTSHGETEAIRDACRNLRTVDLSGCDLYTSCEPCALCVCAMEMAGIRTLIYAATLADAPVILAQVPAKYRNRVPSDVLRREAGLPSPDRRMPSRQMAHEEGLAVLKGWAEEAERLG